MSSTQAEFYERYLLKSLIEDLDLSNLPSYNESFKGKKTTFDSLESPKTDKSQLTDASESLLYKNNLSTSMISKEEIMIALSNQKSAFALQATIKEMTSEEIAHIIEEINEGIGQMMIDRNGNYFCKDIFKVCTSEQRLKVLEEIFESFDVISINEYGTHPIQTLIEEAKSQEEIKIIVDAISIKSKLLTLCQNPNGSYVIQKIIANIPESSRSSFNILLLDSISFLAINMYGVCIVKKFICFCQNKVLIGHILTLISNNFFFIAENQYGNYLIQSLLELWWHKKEMNCFKQFISQCFYRLSRNQFGSHIAETFINMLSVMEKNMFLENLMQSNCYYLLINDKYGMFVMNKLVNSILRSKKMSN